LGDGGGDARRVIEAGSVGCGVGGGNRTLMETFLAWEMADLIRARIESILASRIYESTTFRRAFDGVDGGGGHLEGGREGCVCRDVGRVTGGDAGGDAKGFRAVGGKVCPVLDGGRVVNGGTVLMFWDVSFVGVLLQ
jgi:hypothetical protein